MTKDIRRGVVHLRLPPELNARLTALVSALPAAIGGVSASKQSIIVSILSGERDLAGFERIAGLNQRLVDVVDGER